MAGPAREGPFLKALLAGRNSSQSHPVFAGRAHRPLNKRIAHRPPSQFPKLFSRVLRQTTVKKLCHDRLAVPLREQEGEGSNPPTPARHSCVRLGFPRDARMGRKSGLSCIAFRLCTPGLPEWRRNFAKVSVYLREYSRFGETLGGDRFDHDCHPRGAVDFVRGVDFETNGLNGSDQLDGPRCVTALCSGG
jgi:hypothetical protein